VWMQIIHLLLADALWITAILLAATALSAERAVERTSTYIPQAGD